MQRRSEGRAKFKNGVGNDVDHQRRTAAKTVRHHAKKKCAYRTHGQRNEDGFCNGGNFGVEISADGGYAENQDKEVKGIKRPAKKTGNEGISLNRGKALQAAKESHAILP